jgi:putative lipoprotein (rSAM/lipoprotein system)
MAVIKGFRKTPFILFKLLSLVTGFFLSVFFSIGCTKNNLGTPMYGVSSAEFVVSGTIRSVDQHQPIKGIEVSLGDTLGTFQQGAPVATDSLGKYLLTSELIGHFQQRIVVIHASDIDSSLNGSFLPKDTTISLPDSAFKGASEGYQGLDSANVDLYLKRSGQ